jgi:hypothetical protein
MIIGFSGFKGSGKSTAARALVDAEFNLMSFADPLRVMVRVILRDCGLDEYQIQLALKNKEVVIPAIGVSARHLMQTLGTEWGREHVHPDLWVIAMRHRLASRFDADDDVVFDDVRFENEAALIREFNGVIIHIQRPGFNGDGHLSERGIAMADGDVVIVNDGAEVELVERVWDVVNGVGKE